MLQTLFHIPPEVAGTPLFGFGALFWVWLLGSAVTLGVSYARHGFSEETRGYLPVLLVLGLAIVFAIPAIIDERGLPIRGYGTMLVVAVIAACGLAVWRSVKAGINPELILSLAFWCFLGGIVGARTFYVIEYWHDFASHSPGEMLFEIVNLTQGGLVVYGAIIGGVIAALWFLALYKLPVLAMGDIIAPALALGLGLGRIGCFMNGCCYGGPSDLPWAVQFPSPSPPFQRQVERGEVFMAGLKFDRDLSLPAVIVEVEPNSSAAKAGLAAGNRVIAVGKKPVRNTAQAIDLLLGVEPGETATVQAAGKTPVTIALPSVPARSRPVHPTQLYSAIDGALLCCFLLALYPFRRRDGEVLVALMILHPISRFLLEIVRVDEGGVLGTSLSISQVISLGFLAGAVALFAYLRTKPRGTVVPLAPAAGVALSNPTADAAPRWV